jgi:hypothetical protein
VIERILVRAEMEASPVKPAVASGASQGEIQSPELPELCVGCGMHHGSQGAELACLRNFVRTLRELVARKNV